jgi:WD40 repeat protein
MRDDDAPPSETSEPRLKVFVSYARKDLAVVDWLERRLRERCIKALIDRRDIEKLEDWWERITALIGEADAVIFVLSPDAVESEWPRREAEYAASLNKRLAPVVIADVPPGRVPDSLAKLNYVFMRPGDDVDREFDDLVAALLMDLPWLREHTRLGELARRWRATDESEPGRGEALLLRGHELADAELWISSRPREAPEPTDLHRSFIQQSRRGEQARILHEKEQIAARQRAQRKATVRLWCFFAACIAAASYAAWQSRETDKREAKIMTSLADKAMAEGHYDRAMRIALRALPTKGELKLAFWSDEVEAKLAGAALLSRLRVQLGHAGVVFTAAFSRDGRWIVTASADGTARVWDADGTKQVELIGHKNEVRSAAFSHHGRRIVTASKDETARLWDAENGRELRVLDDHRATVVSATFSPDDRLIVTASYDSTARIWDGVTGTILRTLSGHTDWIWSAAFSPDGTRIVTGSADRHACVWDVASGELVFCLRPHGDVVRNASFSPDGRRIVTASFDGTARIWDAVTGAMLTELSGHEDQVWSAAFTADGERIVTISKDRTARLWSSNGALMEVMRGHAGPLHSLDISPDGRHIATASTDKTVRIWDARTGKETAALVGHGDWVEHVSFSPDGKRIATASEDGTARVWNSERAVRVLKGRTVSFEPGGRRIVSVSDLDERRWDADSGQLLDTLDSRSGRNTNPWYSRDRSLRVEQDPGKAALLLEASGVVRAHLPGHQGKILDAVFSDDALLLATASADETVRLWDTATGRLRHVLKGHRKHVWSAAFSPDGRHVATASEDGTARLWHVASGTEIAELPGHTLGVRAVAFSSDGRRLATGSDDGMVRVWDLRWATDLSGDDLRNRVCLHKLVGAQVMTIADAEDPILTTDNGMNVCHRRGATRYLSNAWRQVAAWTVARHSASARSP